MRIFSFFNVVRLRVNDRWLTFGESDVISWTDCHTQIGLASKHALNERRGFGKSACTREEGCLEHHVIHIEATFCLETSRGHRKRCNVLPRSISLEFFASPRSVS